MKKIFILGLLLFAAFSLTACSKTVEVEVEKIVEVEVEKILEFLTNFEHKTLSTALISRR